MSSAHLVQPGTLVEEKWEVIKLIGKGTFSEIYLAENIHQPENEAVAIKIQTANVDSSVLRWEIQVLKSLQTVNTVPRYFSSGQFDNRDYIIMELLTGEVMSNLRNRIRSIMPSGLVPIQIASYLARQMLTSIRQLHAHGYVHRDIKPSNFVRKDFESTKFLMIDFGLAKQFIDKDGVYRIRKEKTEFRGTTVYASPFVHDGEDQGPRDDLCSILHVFVDLIAGKLPWNEAARNKDKLSVGHLKKRHYDHLPDFMLWIENQVKSMEANKIQSNETNFPRLSQEKILEVFTILKGMRNDEVPDYDRIEMLLYEAVPSSLRHDVSNLNYSFHGFTWREIPSSSSKAAPSLSRATSDGLKRQNTPSNSADLHSPIPQQEMKPLADYFHSSHKSVFLNFQTNQSGNNHQEDPHFFRIKNLFTRMKTLQRRSSTSISSSSGNGNGNGKGEMLSLPSDSEIYSLALRWKNLVKELFTLPETAITRDLIELYYQVLVDYQYFYRMDLGATINGKSHLPDKWTEFIQQQETIALFLQLYDSVKRKDSTSKAVLLSNDDEEEEVNMPMEIIRNEGETKMTVISDEEQLQQIEGGNVEEENDNSYEADDMNRLISNESMMNFAETDNNDSIQPTFSPVMMEEEEEDK